MSEIAVEDKQKLFNLTLGFLVSRSLHIASYYKIFDEIVNEPKTAEQIGKNKNLNPKNLKALLLVLANHNIIEIDEQERFSLNSMSKYLVSNTPNSVQPFIAKFYDKRYWHAVGSVDTSLENDLSPFKFLYG